MPTRHTYASVDDLREYLAGTSYASNWTDDGGIIERILAASSERIDNYVGMYSFGPVIETRAYDSGSGRLRSGRFPTVDVAGNNLGEGTAQISRLLLDRWLITATTVTSYKSTDRATSETLTEGYNNDFWLVPYNKSPKVELRLNEDSDKAFYAGQQTFTIAGTWGYSNDLSAEKTTTGAITSTTVLSWGVNDASGLAVAQTIKVGNEQMYITGISSNTLTVERGVNGTTATTHSAGTSVYIFEYPSLVTQVCLDLAKIFFRDRDMGVTQIIGTGEMGVTRSSNEAKNILRALDEYRGVATDSMVFF